MRTSILALVAIAFVFVSSAALADNVVQVQGDGNFVVVNGGDTAYVGPVVVELTAPVVVVEPVFVVPQPIVVQRQIVVQRRTVVVQQQSSCCPDFEWFYTRVVWGPCTRYFTDTNGIRWDQVGYRKAPSTDPVVKGRLWTASDGVRRYTVIFGNGETRTFKEDP